MTKDFAFSDKRLQNSILNTVRVITEYRLDRKAYTNSTYKIFDSLNGVFYQYQVFKTATGSQLKIYVGSSNGSKISEPNAVRYADLFLRNLDSVLTNQVVLTPQLLNSDVYKSGQTISGMLRMILLIVAGAAVIMALRILIN